MARHAYIQLIEEVTERTPPRSIGVVLKNIRFLRPLVLEKGKVATIRMAINTSNSEEWNFEIFQEDDSPLATGKLDSCSLQYCF